jgi:hypothetical protein
MTQGSPPLRLVERPATARRLNSRREIDEWIAERYRTLSALVEAEGRAGERDQGPAQLELGERAA